MLTWPVIEVPADILPVAPISLAQALADAENRSQSLDLESGLLSILRRRRVHKEPLQSIASDLKCSRELVRQREAEALKVVGTILSPTLRILRIDLIKRFLSGAPHVDVVLGEAEGAEEETVIAINIDTGLFHVCLERLETDGRHSEKVPMHPHGVRIFSARSTRFHSILNEWIQSRRVFSRTQLVALLRRLRCSVRYWEQHAIHGLNREGDWYWVIGATQTERLRAFLREHAEGLDQDHAAHLLGVDPYRIHDISKRAALHFDLDQRRVLPGEARPRHYGKVYEIVLAILGNCSQGLSLEELAKEVLRIRGGVSDWAIRQSLDHATIGENGNGKWGLLRFGFHPPAPKPRSMPAEFQLKGERVLIPIPITRDLERGSGVHVDRWVADWMGLGRPPSNREFRLPDKSSIILRRSLGNTTLSSLRRFALEFGLGVGDTIMLTLDRGLSTATVASESV